MRSLNEAIKQFFIRYSLVIRALFVFTTTVLLFITLLSLPSTARFLNQELAAFTATLTAPLLNLLGLEASTHGTILQAGTFTAKIIAACTPLYPGMFLIAGIIAFPSSLKRKLTGLALTLLAVFAINQIRIGSLIYIGLTAPEFLKTAHYLIWQTLIMFTTVVLWLAWLKQVMVREHR